MGTSSLGPDFVNSSPPPPELVFQSIEETLLQPVLKSFITVFIQCNVGLENKVIRAPLLGLAKSIYYVCRVQDIICILDIIIAHT